MSPRLDVSMYGAPKRRPIPQLGDVVVPDEHPAGVARWRIVAMPEAAGPSDIADLEPIDAGSPLSRIRRRVSTLTIEGAA